MRSRRATSHSPEDEQCAVTDWLERFDDQLFSLTDAVSFAVMSDRGIREALALDNHFAVAGFAVVPPPQQSVCAKKAVS
ncbi:MAG: hypothetical protein ABJB49_02320 [Nitrospirota bacterium]